MTTNNAAKNNSSDHSTRSIAYAGSRWAIATMAAPAVIATRGSDPPASHATTATPNSVSPFTTRGRSSATGTVSSRSRNGSRSSARYAHLEIADDQHEAEQEHQHVEVNRRVGVAQRQHAQDDHRDRAEQARRRPVQVDEGQALDGDQQIGRGEDDEAGGHANAERGTR